MFEGGTSAVRQAAMYLAGRQGVVRIFVFEAG